MGRGPQDAAVKWNEQGADQHSYNAAYWRGQEGREVRINIILLACFCREEHWRDTQKEWPFEWKKNPKKQKNRNNVKKEKKQRHGDQRGASLRKGGKDMGGSELPRPMSVFPHHFHFRHVCRWYPFKKAKVSLKLQSMVILRTSLLSFVTSFWTLIHTHAVKQHCYLAPVKSLCTLIKIPGYTTR